VSQEPLHYSVFAADIQNYSGRHALVQLDLRHLLHLLLLESSAAAGVDRPNWSLQDQGDGELSLVPGTMPKPRLVADFVRELKIGLARHNRRYRPEERLRLRVAMHCGEAHVDGTGFAGDAPVVAARLLNSKPARQALDEVPEADLALILSTPMFEAVNGYRDIEQGDFRRVRVREKTFKATAWVKVPGFASPALAAHTDDAPESGRRTGGRSGRGERRPAAGRPTVGSGSFDHTVFHGPVSFGDGPVAGRDVNYGGK
jgi:hypothetical protein